MCNGIYLALKKNEILICTTTWMNLKNIMLSEGIMLRQTPKDRYCMIPLMMYLK